MVISLERKSTLLKPIHDLPADYHEVRYILLTDDRLLLRLNLLAVIPLVAMIVLMGVWWVVASGGRDASGDTGIVWWIAVIGILLIVLPLHEIIHGITISAFGHRARYGAKLSKGVLYATAENALFRRNEYLAVALAPLVVITLLAMGLMLILPQGWAYYVGIAAVFNAGGAIGDLWAVGVVARYPASALVRDEADGFRIFASIDSDSTESAGNSTQKTEPPPSP